MRIGDLNVISNEKLSYTLSKVFTESGYQKVNSFLINVSRDFRDLFSFLYEMYKTQPATFYDFSFRRVLKDSKSFHKFVLAITVQRLTKTKIPFELFYLPLFESCYKAYEESKETGARNYVFGAVLDLVALYPKAIVIASELVDSLDITENINSNRVIYVDEYIALTFNPDIKNEGLGELLFAARNSFGLWSFDKTDIMVPVRSLRQAKKFLTSYQGKPRKGQLVGNDADRLASFLGLEVKEGYAYMPNYEEPKIYRGKGFKQS